ncbi:MAG: hypothetical protein ABIJ09_18005 [Pseudomonadota bacterium]
MLRTSGVTAAQAPATAAATPHASSLPQEPAPKKDSAGDDTTDAMARAEPVVALKRETSASSQDAPDRLVQPVRDVQATSVGEVSTERLGIPGERLSARIEHAVRLAVSSADSSALVRGIQIQLHDVAAGDIHISLRQGSGLLTVSFVAQPALALRLREESGELRRRLDNCLVIVHSRSGGKDSRRRDFRSSP